MSPIPGTTSQIPSESLQSTFHLCNTSVARKMSVQIQFDFAAMFGSKMFINLSPRRAYNVQGPFNVFSNAVQRV